MNSKNKELIKSTLLIIETIAPDRFHVIGVKDDEQGVRIYLEPKTISPEFFDTDTVIYDLLWQIEQATKH